MQVQVNTSNGIENKESLQRWANDFLNEALQRFSQDLTSVEMQLTDENHAPKAGAVDKRCMLEARMAGRPPVAVTHYAENQDQAVRGASNKLIHALEHVFGKLDRTDHRARETIRRDEALPTDELLPTDNVTR
jgi:hypothetical protein